ncbi:MAG: peptidoglycan-binding protein [Candidatus Paceibacterota bacterium]|jgi:peptidoglycan hydrolase-like protein with peptidoglycan-binding domain
MKKYILFLFVLVFVFGFFNINTKSADAMRKYEGDCYTFGCGELDGTNVTDTICWDGDFNLTFWGSNSCSSAALGNGSSTNYATDLNLKSNQLTTPLKIGSVGNYVRRFQQVLKNKGFLLGKVDGKYGPITDGAAKKFFKSDALENLPAGCTSTAGFSPTTGMPCNGTNPNPTPTPLTLPAGCTSTAGFSPTTGMPCGGTVVNPPPTNSTVTVLSPNGGESWVKGTTQTIRWTDKSDISTHEVKLVPYYPLCTSKICPAYPYHAPYTITNTQGSSYSWMVGQTWETSSVPDGSYTVQICQSSSSNCDSSNTPFSVRSGNVQLPGISSLSPNSGPVQTQVTITGSNFTPTGNIIYFGTAGNAYSVNSTNGTTLVFSVPTYSATTGAPLQPGVYGVYVSNANGKSNTVNFTLTNSTTSSLTVLSPNGGENLVLGSQTNIRWSVATPGTIVGVFLYNTAHSKDYYWKILDGLTSPSYQNSNAWTVGQGQPLNGETGTPGVGTYKIQVCKNLGGSGYSDCDYSNAPFTITSGNVQLPSISSLSPNSGSVGTQVTITGSNFTPTGTVVHFGYGIMSRSIPSSADGTTVTFTVPSFSDVTGLPIQPGIYSVSVDTTNGFSNSVNFTVTSSGTPTITVLSPNGGEQWKIGETHDVTWMVNNLNTATDGVATVVLTGGPSNVPPLTLAHVNTVSGRYTWTIPQTVPPATYRIRIYTSGNLDVTGNTFTIVSSVTLPAGCISAGGYSPTTGVKCDGSGAGPILPAGCTSTAGWSPTTGMKCDGTDNGGTTPPLGCTSTAGYSPYTGLLCAGNNSSTIILTPTYSKTDYNGGSMTAAFAVNSNTNWTVSSNQPWVKLSKISGTGNSTVGFSYLANPYDAGRTALIMVTAGDYNAVYTFKQDGTGTGTGGGVDGEVLGAESFSFTQLLKKGSIGNEVTELQKFLNAAGYSVGTADGKFGAITEAAVIKFQTAKGLTPDGIVGPAVRALLNK